MRTIKKKGGRALGRPSKAKRASTGLACPTAVSSAYAQECSTRLRWRTSGWLFCKNHQRYQSEKAL